MRGFDLSPLFRSSVGFDRMAQVLDYALRAEDTSTSYPPYNIEKTGENQYRITMAVAGFRPEELNATVKEDVLYISGKSQDARSEGDVLYRGIAARAFERRFQLAEHIRVDDARLENGLLHVNLVREVPEAKKPRTIAINGVESARSLPPAENAEQQQAA